MTRARLAALKSGKGRLTAPAIWPCRKALSERASRSRTPRCRAQPLEFRPVDQPGLAIGLHLAGEAAETRIVDQRIVALYRGSGRRLGGDRRTGGGEDEQGGEDRTQHGVHSCVWMDQRARDGLPAAAGPLTQWMRGSSIVTTSFSSRTLR